MSGAEFEQRFDVLFNNITSNQAPGYNSYEKDVFFTKAQNEIVKDYFSAQSKGNNLRQGFDDSAKRQADFSSLMQAVVCEAYAGTGIIKIDERSSLYEFPSNVFIPVNEVIKTAETPSKNLQVVPLRYDEYLKEMSKPYKRPNRYQAWRLINSVDASTQKKYVELILGPNDTISSYTVRYIRAPKPIITSNLGGLTIDGYTYGSGPNQSEGCELDPMLHEEILQRAVELAKIAWTATVREDVQLVTQAGQRSE